jgi:hypothetical protein
MGFLEKVRKERFKLIFYWHTAHNNLLLHICASEGLRPIHIN